MADLHVRHVPRAQGGSGPTRLTREERWGSATPRGSHAVYGGDRRERDAAYHQGTVWSWLLGPFALAHARVHGDRQAALRILDPLGHHLSDHGVGSIAEILDGDPPFTPRGSIAQAWGVAETLRAWHELTTPRARRRAPAGRASAGASARPGRARRGRR